MLRNPLETQHWCYEVLVADGKEGRRAEGGRTTKGLCVRSILWEGRLLTILSGVDIAYTIDLTLSSDNLQGILSYSKIINN